MFGRKYNPQEIAEHLRTWIAHGQARELIGGYFASVRPDEPERTRIMFSLHIFPIAASYSIAEAKNDARLIEAVRRAHDLYLSCFRDRDQIVRLGDYVIWRGERDAGPSGVRGEGGPLSRSCALLVTADWKEKLLGDAFSKPKKK